MDRLRQIRSDIAICLVFFTRLPLPTFDFGTRSLAAAIWAAPLAGLVVALIGGGVYALASFSHLTPNIAAALALAGTMAATGCLHEDGLSDVADGFGGGRTRERKLEIMRDSRIGAYGAAALMLSILLRWSALAAFAQPFHVLLGLIAAHAASRALLPAFMYLTPPARTDGLGAGAGRVDAATAFVALGIGLATLLFLGLPGCVAALVMLALTVFASRWLCLRQIGGQTGDTLGALQQLSEIIVLIVATAALS